MSKRINAMTREDFVQTVSAAMFMSMGSTEEIMGEMIHLYLFLQKKGLADECQDDKELQAETIAIMREGQKAMLDALIKLEESKGKPDGK